MGQKGNLRRPRVPLQVPLLKQEDVRMTRQPRTQPARIDHLEKGRGQAAMKRVFQRREGAAAASARIQPGATPRSPSRAASFAFGRSLGAEAAAPASPARDSESPAHFSDPERRRDAREQLARELEAKLAAEDEKSGDFEAVRALRDVVGAEELSYADIRELMRLLRRPGGSQDGDSESSSGFVRSAVYRLLGGVADAHRWDAPAVTLNLSTDGFACLQVPEVITRGAGAQQSSVGSSGPSALYGGKIWPPTDGYTVSVWLRVDRLERKDERDAFYRECFIAKKCIHCLRILEDERALKCSHFGCRACIDALLNSGGECAICNPPTIYLFRFRSGDGKSISEGFLKGGKIFMRSSAGNHQLVQFHHKEIRPGTWNHVTFVHARQRFQSSSVSLYLNGLLQETTKCSYPSGVTTQQPLSGTIGVPVQSRRRSSTTIQLGPFYLIDEPLPASIVNTLFAAGPSYGKLFFGETGRSDVRIALKNLRLQNLIMLDDYMRDPVQELIESVDTERIAKSSIIRSGLSLASAASATAAAIVHDIKTNGNIFSRLPSAAPSISIPISSERILLLLAPSNAVDSETVLIPSGKLDGRPTAQGMGGVTLGASSNMTDMLYLLSGSGCQLAYSLLHEANSSAEVETALSVLRMMMDGHINNLIAMENEHGYGIVNLLLHQKAFLLNKQCLRILLDIVGIKGRHVHEMNSDDEVHPSERQTIHPSVITNMQALQYFLLDFSLWRKVERSTRKQLFSSLYLCSVAADDEALLERNRSQLQSVSFLKQLLPVLIEPTIDVDFLQVIADLILVSLTSYKSSVNEENFSEVAGFLSMTLSPNFGQAFATFDPNNSLETEKHVRQKRRMTTGGSDRWSRAGGPIDFLGLSPRGRDFRRNSSLGLETSVFEYVEPDSANSDENDNDFGRCANNEDGAVAIIQNMLLDVLQRAVQKLDLKLSRENEDATSTTASATETVIDTNQVQTSTGTNEFPPASRIQLANSRLSGFRKVLNPRWVSNFLLSPQAEAYEGSNLVSLHPTTVLRALKLFGVLIRQHSYESVCRKEHFYRLLAHGLPCHLSASRYSGFDEEFPLHDMWYELMCMVLGTPVDGVPHKIQFEPYYLTKDFEGNIRRNVVYNPHIMPVIVTVIRRFYNDPAGIAMLPRLTDPNRWNGFEEVGNSEKTTTHGHEAALEFVAYLHKAMPCFHSLIVSPSSDRFRHEMIDELSLVVCAAARYHVTQRYAPRKSQIIRTLLAEKKEANLFEYTLLQIKLAEEAALLVKANSGVEEEQEDPFAHPVAQWSLNLLVTILLQLMLDTSNGSELIEAFFENTVAAGGGLSPPLHDGLALRFHAVVLLNLLDRVRGCFHDDNILTEHKAFGYNCREFLRLAVRKMQCWQRAQQGDGCPGTFSCCEPYHFSRGQFRVLDLALFVLTETSIGIAGSTTSTGSASLTSTNAASLGVMLSDKLAKGKKKRPLRNLLGRIAMPRSAELEALTSEFYVTLNTTILHILSGHRVIISDAELEAALLQLHTYREVVLGSRNNQGKEFFVCLCRYLLQLLVDTSTPKLQDAAAHLWTDLMYFQRSFMAKLLMVEIRRPGASPYSVNLMKNGFDVLLEAHPGGGTFSGISIGRHSNQRNSEDDEPSFAKLSKWLQVVGPPLRELENNLDKVFMKHAMESSDFVRNTWVTHHKSATHQMHKFLKRFDAHLVWSQEMLRGTRESLRSIQVKEFRRQMKWSQDCVDREKFNLRQWHLMTQKLSHVAEVVTNRISCGDYLNCDTKGRLNFTEGPQRMRKRLIWYHTSTSRLNQEGTDGPGRYRPSHTIINAFASCRDDDNKASNLKDAKITRDNESVRWKRRIHLRRRRYSADDADTICRREPQSIDSLELRSQSLRPGGSRWVQSDPISTPTQVKTYHSFDLMSSGDSYTSDDISGGDDLSNEFLISTIETRPGVIGIEVEREESSPFSIDDDAVDEKIRPLLMPGDEIENAYDCLRVDGMDSCPGVFLLCTDYMYIIDSYQKVVQRTLPPLLSAGTEAPHQQVRVTEVATGSTTRLERRLGLHNRVTLNPAVYEHASLSTSPSTAPPQERASFSIVPGKEIVAHQCRYWAFEDILELHKRRYQLQHIALELFANDGRNYLIAFESREEREAVFHALLSKCPNVRGAASGLDRSATSGGDLYSQLRKLLRNSMTERWVNGNISNFEYLMHLNTLAGRSYNDLTQYPVFPWILSDYISEDLDLKDPGVYRDLSKPMGALYREEEFRMRYDSLAESAVMSNNNEDGTTKTTMATGTEQQADNDDPLLTKPFHYGTHYSSAAITLHYLMRLEPFTTYFRNLHDGKFDHADRLFASIQGAWKSAAGVEGAQNGGTQDVKELTPEFFYLPAFLRNLNSCNFGRDQSGLSVGDVALPPWANGSPAEFVRLNREALESSFVSASLHHWIDLIFGYKQQGTAAVEACNVFYHLTYEGAVDLDAIKDPATKRAIVAQIAEFGQTPSQLFKSPHPARSRTAIAASGGVGSNASLTNSFMSTSVGPYGAYQMGGVATAASFYGAPNNGRMTDTPEIASSDNAAVISAPLTARSLATSFLEGGEIMNRVQTIIAGSGTTNSSDELMLALDQAPLLQAERLRDIPVNSILAANRPQWIVRSPSEVSTTPRRRLLSTGSYASSISQISMTSGTLEKRVAALGSNCLFLPPRNLEFLAWGFQDRSLKILTTGISETGSGNDSKVVASFDVEFDINVAAVSSDGRTLITGSGNMPVMRVWRIDTYRKASLPSLSASATASRLRYYSSSSASFAPLTGRIASGSGGGGGSGGGLGAHSTPKLLTVTGTISSPCQSGAVTAICVSREFSIFASGSACGATVLWDLNRRTVIRSLVPIAASDPPTSIATIAINEVTGDIVVASGERFGVYDVNGALRVRLDYATLFHDPKLSRASIVSLALERLAACEWRAEKRVVTGHADGVLCVWAYVSAGAGGGFGSGADEDDDEWTLELQARHSSDAGSAITAVYLSADERKLWSGSADGVLRYWPSRPASSPPAGGSASVVPLPATP